MLGFSVLLAYLLLLRQNSLAQSQAAADFVEAKKVSQANTAAVLAKQQEVTIPQSNFDSDVDIAERFFNKLDASAERSDKSLWSDAFIDHNQQAVAKGGDSAIALLRIPRVDLDVAVFDGADKHNLNRGAARIESTGSINSDQRIGIAGHRDGWFRPLKDIQLGDIIELETLTDSRRYQISKTHIVTPFDVGVLQGDDHTLVLVTCYPFYFVGSAPQRFIVEAVLLTDES